MSHRMISAILRHDSRQKSYKIALLRALNDVVLPYPDMRDTGAVAVKLRMLAEAWIAYYWPFVTYDAPLLHGVRSNLHGRPRNDVSFRPSPHGAPAIVGADQRTVGAYRRYRRLVSPAVGNPTSRSARTDRSCSSCVPLWRPSFVRSRRVARRGSQLAGPALAGGRGASGACDHRSNPQHGRLLLIWNWHYDWSKRMGGVRRPLAAAISSDGGANWPLERRRILEEDTDATYAYPSCTFVEDTAVISYYASSAQDPFGARSLKLLKAPIASLYGLLDDAERAASPGAIQK